MKVSAPLLATIGAVGALAAFLINRKVKASEAAAAAAAAAAAPATQDVNPDLTDYPIHGAPAIPDQQGSRNNLLATYPSLITNP